MHILNVKYSVCIRIKFYNIYIIRCVRFYKLPVIILYIICAIGYTYIAACKFVFCN